MSQKSLKSAMSLVIDCHGRVSQKLKTHLDHRDGTTQDDVPILGGERGRPPGDNHSHQSHQFDVVGQDGPLCVTQGTGDNRHIW